MSLRTSAHEPAQKPARSEVIWTGRPAGESRCSTTRTWPPATVGVAALPNSSCTRTASTGGSGS